ncbi:MAG: hypothetical protein OEZ30_10385 [Candidatus Aminicenantes bacterium]|nr:hypothetical protein [Candidatus Aminicenantes bacterium]
MAGFNHAPIGRPPSGWTDIIIVIVVEVILIAYIRYAYHLAFHNAKLSFIIKYYRIKSSYASYKLHFS